MSIEIALSLLRSSELQAQSNFFIVFTWCQLAAHSEKQKYRLSMKTPIQYTASRLSCKSTDPTMASQALQPDCSDHPIGERIRNPSC